MIRTLLLVLAAICSFGANSAVILQYHHIADDTPAVTSVSPELFREHMQFLAQENFNVVPLSVIVDSIRKGEALADNTVAITFDDGYKNIAENAHPILKAFQFPYTLFVAIDPIKQGFSEMMDWPTLQRLLNEGAELANHTMGHEHLIRRHEAENEQQWLERVELNVLAAESELKIKTGKSLKMLAYPYGEYNAALQNLLRKHGFSAVGQQSGAAGIYSDITAIPRFPVAGVYAELNSLKVKIRSLNMPVTELNPTDPELKNGLWRPVLSVTLDMSDISAGQVMCFVQGQGAKKPMWVADNQFTVQADTDLPAGRSRYNCTAPSQSTGNYYWFSQPWVRTQDDGQWRGE